MSSFLNFACGAARSRSPRGILQLTVLNPCAAREILPRALCVCTACGKALQPVASLGLKRNSCFKILKQGLRFISALAFFGRNFFFKIYTRFKFKDGLPKRSCLASPTAPITAVPASLTATLPTARATSSALTRSSALAQVQASMQASAQVPVQIRVQARASVPSFEQVQARARTKFKSVVSKSVIFKSTVSQSTDARRAISKFTKFTIFSLAAFKFKNGPLAQRRALV